MMTHQACCQEAEHRPPFEPAMTSWILGEDVVAIRLGDEPGAFDRAVAEVLVALDLDLREDLPEDGTRAEPRPLDDLVLELGEPEIYEEEGTRRAAARARLVFRPADPGKRRVESKPFRFVAPLGPIEAEDLAWYPAMVLRGQDLGCGQDDGPQRPIELLAPALAPGSAVAVPGGDDAAGGQRELGVQGVEVGGLGSLTVGESEEDAAEASAELPGALEGGVGSARALGRGALQAVKPRSG